LPKMGPQDEQATPLADRLVYDTAIYPRSSYAYAPPMLNLPLYFDREELALFASTISLSALAGSSAWQDTQGLQE